MSADSSSALLRVDQVSKAFASGQPVLRDVSLAVAEGEIVCLLGPSGCGKTTLLRIVAGLELADQGRVFFDGRDQAEVPVHRRRFGLMFQDFALFPHRTVGQNIAFGLRMAGEPSATVTQRVQEMLDLVDLPGYGDRSVFALSGGERQRVALARSLAPHPRLLMLDEPLGSLDRTLREELMGELRAILKRVGVTSIYVTHDQQEAFAVADRLVVMRQGAIEQVGAPLEIYASPATAFVARFLGFQNLLPASVTAAQPDRVSTPIGNFPLAQLRSGPAAPGEHLLLVRPDAATVLAPGQANGGMHATQPTVRATVRSCSFRGNHYRVEVRVMERPEPVRLLLELPTGALLDAPVQLTAVCGMPAAGDWIDLAIDPRRLALLPAE